MLQISNFCAHKKKYRYLDSSFQEKIRNIFRLEDCTWVMNCCGGTLKAEALTSTFLHWSSQGKVTT